MDLSEMSQSARHKVTELLKKEGNRIHDPEFTRRIQTGYVQAAIDRLQELAENRTAEGTIADPARLSLDASIAPVILAHIERISKGQ